MIEGHVKSVNTDGSMVFETAAGSLIQAAAGKRDSTTLALRSSYIHLRPDEVNMVAGTIHRRMFHGDFIQYVVDWPCGQLLVRRPPTDVFAEGSAVTVSFAPEHCVVL
jgi:ABC-type Fe3+/spermidine/putrescine transport system ATPase subunit